VANSSWGKTFGVILMVGEDQARLIEELLAEYLPAQERKGRYILAVPQHSSTATNAMWSSFPW